MGAVASSDQFNDQQTNRLGANEVASLLGVGHIYLTPIGATLRLAREDTCLPTFG